MARTKMITDEQLLILLEQYFRDVCHSDPCRIEKYSKITLYIQRHGYPEYKETTLRRDAVARNYIDSLKAIAKNQPLKTVVAYSTLDVHGFLERNTTRSMLVKALTEQDQYYKSIAESAVIIHQQYQKACQSVEKANTELESIQKEKDDLLQQVFRLKSEVKTLTKDNCRLKKIVNQYVYPKIANELLAQDGILKKEENIIVPEALSKSLIKADTQLEYKEKDTAKTFENDVINSLMKGFEDGE